MRMAQAPTFDLVDDLQQHVSNILKFTVPHIDAFPLGYQRTGYTKA